MKKVIDEVLEAITPSKKEGAKLKLFVNEVLPLVRKEGHSATVEGSLAKDTWISGNHDIDVFVFFDESTPRETLVEEGLEIGKKVITKLGGKPQIAYAEHPYTRAKIRDFDLDIVPCYSIKDPKHLKSSVDRTPFHTSYVKKTLTKEQKAEVRLLKQFTKGVGIYSAKEKVRGFSGYLCELLVIHYGSFKKILRKAQTWEYGIVVDPGKLYKNKKSAFEKFKHSLVVIDPTDMNRNVAAALEDDNFERFIIACTKFMDDPSTSFFFPNLIDPFTLEKLKKELSKRGEIILLKFKTPKIVEDVLYSQLRHSLKAITELLRREEFEVIDSDFLSDKHSYFLIELKQLELPEIQKLEGPPIKIDKKFQDVFVKKYAKQKPWAENGRWYVAVKRKHTNAVKFMEKILEEPREKGISSYIAKSITKDYAILLKKELKKEYEGGFARFLTKFLTKKESWDW